MLLWPQVLRPGARYSTIDELQAATNQESSGITNEPGLSDPGGGDFMPTRLSPLVDRGELLPGINDTFSGKRPDIGAREYVFPLAPSIPALLLDN
jgi:hypothetical protein